jgi:hypothetical protein
VRVDRRPVALEITDVIAYDDSGQFSGLPVRQL